MAQEEEGGWRNRDKILLWGLGVTLLGGIATTLGLGLLLTSPIWIPLLLLFSPIIIPVAIVGSIIFGGLGAFAAFCFSAWWLYAYSTGQEPVFSEKVEKFSEAVGKVPSKIAEKSAAMASGVVSSGTYGALLGKTQLNAS